MDDVEDTHHEDQVGANEYPSAKVLSVRAQKRKKTRQRTIRTHVNHGHVVLKS